MRSVKELALTLYSVCRTSIRSPFQS